MNDNDAAGELAAVRWRTSSHSGGGNDCVEVAFTGGATAVRDSKDRRGGGLTVSARGWDGLLRSARSGALDPG
ncbi:DUF397 domain-containing protein [Amycolatopsis antarctica]|uniref:DUF397 domain-containing protein n=1 Tax=Amycolatopsis antarctica TaxID=1854586 RepID=A0A263DAJ9_9PSEU|nr:DUF397 domain-containing protein [Amycolatopsis antarctica]OZM74547.1 DUF397 domain-containing protein [Amycolatopsis antarctica]